MANRSSNRAAVPEAKGALDKFKYEVANELGVPLTDGYNGDLTSRQNGSVGGYMVKKMIEEQEKQMHKRQPEFPVVTRESRRNSRKTTWLHRHRKMKPFPATAHQEKSRVRNWRSKGHLAPLMRPTKFPEIPVSLERNTEVFRHPLL